MHKEEVQLLLNRSKNFLEGAEQRYKKGDWDLTCFLAEQATDALRIAKELITYVENLRNR